MLKPKLRHVDSETDRTLRNFSQRRKSKKRKMKIGSKLKVNFDRTSTFKENKKKKGFFFKKNQNSPKKYESKSKRGKKNKKRKGQSVRKKKKPQKLHFNGLKSARKPK